MKVEFKISNKTLFLVLGLLISLTLIVGVNAWNGNTPSQMGHSFGEIGLVDANNNGMIDLTDRSSDSDKLGGLTSDKYSKFGCDLLLLGGGITGPTSMSAWQGTGKAAVNVPLRCINNGCMIFADSHMGDYSQPMAGGIGVIYYQAGTTPDTINGYFVLGSGINAINGDTLQTQLLQVPGRQIFLYDDDTSGSVAGVVNGIETNPAQWVISDQAPSVDVRLIVC